jgi:hypothetical protein
MIIDKALVLGDAQAVTASAETTNVIDQLAAGGAKPQGVRAKVQFLIDTTCLAAGGASTVTFALQDSADNVTFATVVNSAAIAKASLVAGYIVELDIPVHTRRYLRGYYTVDTNDLTAGNIDCRIVLDTTRDINERSL